MGRDKALIEIAGEPMVVRVAAAARAAGARDVVAIGRGPGSFATLGLASMPDDRPGEGPVAGIVTAAAWGAGSAEPVVLVVGCDLIAPSPDAISATVAALAADAGAEVAVPAVAGRRQWAHAAWRTTVAAALRAELDAGRRGVGEAVVAAGLGVVEVPGIDPAALVDADTPDDLPPAAAGEAGRWGARDHGH
jgi:molybdopterin-guanine dinucleotide biosynthesis protein A